MSGSAVVVLTRDDLDDTLEKAARRAVEAARAEFGDVRDLLALLRKQTGKVLNVAEAAAYCGYRSPDPIYRAIAEKRLPAVKRGRHPKAPWQIDRDDLDAFLLSGGGSPETDA